MDNKVYDREYIKEVFVNDRSHVIHSWSIQSKLNPIVVNEAEGVYFWDGKGKRYIDMASQLINSNIGHKHPKVVKAIQEQAEKLCFVAPGFATETRSTLAKKLSEVCPGNINRFFFTNGGADANENAVKIAKMYTRKTKIISRYRSYHGATYGAISLTGDPRRAPVEPAIPGVVRVFDPYCYRCSFGKEYPNCKMECISHIEEIILYENPDTIAAFILEPITGSNGVFIPPKEYMKRLRELCNKYNIVLIADEVMSGFGRTGKWFGMNLFDVVPDIMTMAKGINSGYVPLGAVGVSDKIYEVIKDKFLYCGLTYSGHALACAAAIATIDAYKEEKLIDNAAAMGIVMADLMKDMQYKHPCVGDVRNVGLFGVIELTKNRKSREPIVPWNSTGEVMAKITRSLLDSGVYMYIRWNYMFVVPPVIINKEQMKEAFKTIDRALDIGDKYVE